MQDAEPNSEPEASLAGSCIVVFESRMSQEARRLFERRGATILCAPALREVPLEDQRSAFEFGEKLLTGEIDVLVLMTGVGTHLLVDALCSRWDRERVLAEIGRIKLVCRGPKPASALKALGLKPHFTVAEPNTWRSIVTAFDEQGLGTDQSVWVQEYGRSNLDLITALEARSKSVGKVVLYGWQLPSDLEPLKAAVAAMISGSVDIAAFTAGVQIDHLVEVAGRLGLEAPLLQTMKENVVVASIGPMTTERLSAHGIEVDIEPEHPKLGHLVQAVTARAKDSSRQKRRNARY